VSRGLPARPVRRVILISLDCLRADHLGCYGYPADTSPHLDALASEDLAIEIAAFMRSLDEHRPVPGGSGSDPGAGDLDEQLKEQLEQLGYL